MPIQTSEPIIIQPIASKTYNNVWIKDFSIRTISPQHGSVYIETIAYDPDSQTTDTSIIVDEIREDLWEIVYNVPEAAAVMQTFLSGMEAALPAIRQYIANKNAPPQ